GEALALGLLSDEHGQGAVLAREALVDADHAPRLLQRLLRRGVGGVALLPEELRGAQERPGTELPPHHAAPLVVEEREVAVALHPLAVELTEERLRRRPDGVRLLELLAAGVGDDG